MAPDDSTTDKRRWWPLGLGAVAVVVTGLVHWFVVAGWCGYYDGGPQKGQRWACEEIGPLWSLLLVVVTLGGLAWVHGAKNPPSRATRYVMLIVAAFLWRLVPFELAPGTGL